MKTISISNHIESYADMPTNEKATFLQYILFNDLYFDDPVKDWLGKAVKSERDDLPRSIMTEALAAHVDESEVRDAIETVLKELPRDSLTYSAVKEILITALTDDMEDVKTWSTGLIRAYEKINPADETKLSDFLARHLEDETLSPRLRWHAAIGLSHIGTRPAIRKLIAFGKSLMQKIPVSGQNIGSNIHIFLAEKVADSLGSACEKISGYIGERKDTLNLLKEMDEQIGDASDKSYPIFYAIRRIKAHPHSLCDWLAHLRKKLSHMWGRFAQEIQEILEPKLISAMATACLIISLGIFSWLYRPIFTDILLIGNPTIQTRDQAPAKGPAKKEFVLKQGDALESGDSLRIKVSVDRDAYVYVLLCDSSGEIAKFFSDRLEGGKTLLLPSEYEPFELDEHPGTETVFVLTSKKAIDQFNEKLAKLKKAGIEEIDEIFSDAWIRSFQFEHR